jgi:hypothetical protein
VGFLRSADGKQFSLIARDKIPTSETLSNAKVEKLQETEEVPRSCRYKIQHDTKYD